MTLTLPRGRGGIHSFTAINRTTKIPYGIARVLGNFEALLEREMVDLLGGSNPNTWDVMEGSITPDMSLIIREYAPWLYELAGFTKTTIAAEPNGDVTAIANAYGTSVQDAATGIASVAISATAGAPDDIKEGVYTVIAVSPTTIDIYCDTNIDFLEGTDKEYVDDTLKITSSPLTIVQSADTDVAGFGFKLTGGSGTIGMTTGDTATFEVRRVNQGRHVYTYTQNPVPIELGAYFYAQKKNDDQFQRVYFPRLKMASVPQLMTEKNFSEFTLSFKILYDSTLGKSFEVQDIIK